MPLFEAPAENSDGGYAVSSYRAVDPALGTMAELRGPGGRAARGTGSRSSSTSSSTTRPTSTPGRRRRARATRSTRRSTGSSPTGPCPTRTSARCARSSPTTTPGSFVPVPTPDGLGERWVWATFHSFQWDLNYANPAVFRAMAARDAVPGEPGRRHPADGCRGVHLEAARHLVRVAAAGAPAAAGVQRGLPDRRAGRAVQVGGDRAPRRGDRVHLGRRVPAVLRPAADGADLELAGDAGTDASSSRRSSAGTRCPPGRRGSATCAATTTSAGPSPTRTPPSSASTPHAHRRFLNRVLRRPVPRLVRARRAVPGQPAHGGLPHRGHDGVAGGAGGGRRGRGRPDRARPRDRAVHRRDAAAVPRRRGRASSTTTARSTSRATARTPAG